MTLLSCRWVQQNCKVYMHSETFLIFVMKMAFRTSCLCVYSTVFFIGFLDSSEAFSENPANIIDLPYGKIQGHELKSLKNVPFYAYQEIPYASPPIGRLRFKEAVPSKSWSGILSTTKNTKVCMQLYADDPRETEDCLYLNVYTPVNTSRYSTSNPLPVYVFVHEGYYCKNDATIRYLGPQFLMDYGIIVVTMNYRLGAFGFLSTANDVIPGNLGLKDQVVALKWVKDNIYLFGGDPRKVTIGGQSSGAAAVGYLMLTEKSAGLFRGVIMQSGSPLCGKMYQKNPRYFAFELGSLLDNNFGHHNSSQELLHVLQKVSAKDIKENSEIEIPLQLRNSVGNEDNRIWAPVQDGYFVNGPMHENLKLRVVNSVPILMGITSEEQLAFELDPLKAKYFDSDASLLINGNLNIKKQNKLPAGKKLKAIYTNSSFEKEFGSFVKYLSAAKYTTAVSRHADLQSKYTDIFFFLFSYYGLMNNNNVTIPGAERTGHGENNDYIFQKFFYSNIEKVPESDVLTQSRLLKLVTNFVKYLNPTPAKDSLFSGMKWPKVTPEELLYMNINSTLRIEKDPKEYQEWKQVYDKYAEDLQTTY